MGKASHHTCRSEKGSGLVRAAERVGKVNVLLTVSKRITGTLLTFYTREKAVGRLNNLLQVMKLLAKPGCLTPKGGRYFCLEDSKG